MESFAKVPANQVGQTVVDKTGLPADYDFKLEFVSDMNQALARRKAPKPNGRNRASA